MQGSIQWSGWRRRLRSSRRPSGPRPSRTARPAACAGCSARFSAATTKTTPAEGGHIACCSSFVPAKGGSEMFQLRRITDQVLDRGAKAAENFDLQEVRQRGNEVARKAYERSNDAARLAYDYAINHRKATTAVLLGTSIAAALIWMINKNGGYAAMRRKVMQRVRGSATRAPRSRRRVTQTATQ